MLTSVHIRFLTRVNWHAIMKPKRSGGMLRDDSPCVRRQREDPDEHFRAFSSA